MTMCGLCLLLFTPLFDIIVNKALDYLPNHYRYYYNQGLQNSLRATLISSFYLFLIVFNLGKLKGKEIIYGKLSLISTILSLLAIKVSMITRVGMYFDLFLIITIPHIFSRIEKNIQTNTFHSINRNLLIKILFFFYNAFMGKF